MQLPYLVVSEIYLSSLEERIDEYMAKGYVPQGGVAITVIEIPNFRGKQQLETTYYQAMVLQPGI